MKYLGGNNFELDASCDVGDCCRGLLCPLRGIFAAMACNWFAISMKLDLSEGSDAQHLSISNFHYNYYYYLFVKTPDTITICQLLSFEIILLQVHQ